MLTIRESMQALDERKAAVMGPEHQDGEVLQYAATPEQDRAILSGYDIDHNELLEVLEEWTEFFCQLSQVYGLRVCFRAALADAFQVGLIKGADSRE